MPGCWYTVLPLCLLDLDKRGNELRFPITLHSHSSIQSQFTATALLLVLTLVILLNYIQFIYILIHWTYYTRAHVEWEVKARSSGTDSAQRAICHISKIYNSVFIVWIREKNDTKRVSIQFIVFSFISFIIDSVVWHEIRKELVFVSHYMHLEIDVFYDSCFVFLN